MKRILTLLFVLFSVAAYSQISDVPIGNTRTLTRYLGAITGNQGIIFPTKDTVNNIYNTYPGTVVFWQGKLWVRIPPAWVEIGSGGSGGVSNGNKVDITVSNSTWTINNGAVTNAKIAIGVDAGKIGDGTVSNTEYQALNNVTGNIQSQLGSKADTSITLPAGRIVSGIFSPARLAGGTPTTGQVPIYQANGSVLWATPPSGSGGVTDGNKTDITVSGTGSTWTINNNSVTNTKIVSVAASKITNLKDSINKAITDSSSLLSGRDFVTENGLVRTRKGFVQTYTSGSTVISSDSTTILLLNPPSTVSSLTVTLPTTFQEAGTVSIPVGGSITSGTVINTLTFTSSATIVGSFNFSNVVVEDRISYQFLAGKWYRAKL